MDLYLLGLGALVLAALVAAVAPSRVRTPLVVAVGSLGCVLCASAAAGILASGRTQSLDTRALLPFVGTDLTLDALSALFVVTIAAVALAVLVYCLGYVRDETASRPALALLIVFIASLVAVPAAASAATFMVSWELMAATSALLILVEQRRHPEARAAAQWYAAMTQWGAMAILLGLLLASAKGGQSFADIRSHAASLSPALRGAVFVLTLVGFASKAGAVPLHVWLPKAHPAAPSPVSALMSSAMVALGIYGVLRVDLVLLGPGALWWWLVVIALGATSALYGALHATTSSDLKRLLAYSTIDIVGLVMLGVGCSGALVTTGHAALAHVALVGSLMLLVAHAAYKGCLFLGAGAVERATATRDLDRLGGLAQRMPRTSALFALAALSLVAVPTLSGFSSEWLLLEGMLHGFLDRNTSTDIGLLVGVAALALTGGLSAVAVVKTLGIGFLGQPRSAGAHDAREAPATTAIAMALLGLPCVVLGVAPGLAIEALNRAANVGGARVGVRAGAGASLVLARLHGTIEPLVLLAALVVAGVVLWGLVRWRAGAARPVPAWRGGAGEPSPRMQYTATSFGEPLQRVFADVLRPEVDVEVTHAVESRFYEQAVAYTSRVDDTVERFLYVPAIGALRAWGRRARGIQNGSVHRYLAFGFVALLVALVVLA